MHDDTESASEYDAPQQSALRRFLVTFETSNCFYSVARPYREKIGHFKAVFSDTAEPVIVALRACDELPFTTRALHTWSSGIG